MWPHGFGGLFFSMLSWERWQHSRELNKRPLCPPGPPSHICPGSPPLITNEFFREYQTVRRCLLAPPCSVSHCRGAEAKNKRVSVLSCRSRRGASPVCDVRLCCQICEFFFYDITKQNRYDLTLPVYSWSIYRISKEQSGKNRRHDTVQSEMSVCLIWTQREQLVEFSIKTGTANQMCQPAPLKRIN